MIIGVGLDQRLRLSLDELLSLAKDATSFGFESMWTPSMMLPDSFHVCAGWTDVAKQVGYDMHTGIGVMPAPRLWKPESLALQAGTLSELSSGRFVLGIGTGGYANDSWHAMGLPDRPITIMREYLTVLKSLFSGENVTFSGSVFKVADFALDHPVEVPVYLAALGPQMLRLAGAHADGVCLNWATPDQITASAEQVAIGAASVGRDPTEISMSMYIRVCIDDDVERARRALATQVLGYGLARPGVDKSLSYRGLFGRMGFDDTLTKIEEKRDKGVSMSDLLDDAPEGLLERLGYYGPAAEAPARFRELCVGLDQVMVRIVTARRGVDPVLEAMDALSPGKIRSAQ